jgi:hypothetical protein
LKANDEKIFDEKEKPKIDREKVDGRILCIHSLLFDYI